MGGLVGAQAELRAEVSEAQFARLDAVFSALDAAVERLAMFKYQHVGAAP